MKTVYHYFGRYGEEFQKMLDEQRIRYTVSTAPFDTDEPPILSFNLESTSKNFEQQYANVSLYTKPLTIWSDYTKSEFESALWLSIIPKRHCVEITNSEEAFFYYCRKIGYIGNVDWIHDQEQISDLKITKVPNQTRTVFYNQDEGSGIIFADERLKKMITENNLQGIIFRPTLTKTGKVRPYFYQLTSENIIPREQIALGHGETYSECSYCYSKQIILDNTHPLYLKGPAENMTSDFYVTASIFGTGIAHPKYLISHRFYQCLKNEKMTYSLHIEPVFFEI